VVNEAKYIAAVEVVIFKAEHLLHSHVQKMPMIDELSAQIQACFMGHSLQFKQCILACFEGSSIRLTVAGLTVNHRHMQTAFAMGRHLRLGAKSPLLHLLPKIVDIILDYAFQDAFLSAIISPSSTIVVELENIWLSDEVDWDNGQALIPTSNSEVMSPASRTSSLSSHPSFSLHTALPEATCLPFFPNQSKPFSIVGPSASCGTLLANTSLSRLDTQSCVAPSSLRASGVPSSFNDNTLQSPVPERRNSLFRQPDRCSPGLPETVQRVMISAGAKMDQLSDQLQALTAEALLLDVTDMLIEKRGAKGEKNVDSTASTIANLKKLLCIREEQMAVLQAQLALSLQQVGTLEDSLVGAMANSFLNPEVRTEILEVPVEVRTLQQEIKEVRVVEQVPFVQEKVVYVPSPQVVKHTEKIVAVTKEVPKMIVREVIVHQPFQVEIIRDIPVEIQVPIEVETIKEKIVTLQTEKIVTLPVDRIVEKEVVQIQVVELTKEIPVPVIQVLSCVFVCHGLCVCGGWRVCVTEWTY
jgi:hypothetical protein